MIGRMAKNSNGWMRRLRARPQYHSRHFGRRLITSGLPLEMDIVKAGRHFAKVP
jgi:hypothetical protein